LVNIAEKVELRRDLSDESLIKLIFRERPDPLSDSIGLDESVSDYSKNLLINLILEQFKYSYSNQNWLYWYVYLPLKPEFLSLNICRKIDNSYSMETFIYTFNENFNQWILHTSRTPH
jgi:hypothetical protein